MSSLKLVYFDAKGLAEISRIILALANVEYHDVRYPLEVITVDNVHTYNKHKFDEDKKNGLFEKSMGKLPFLEINDQGHVFTITQSKAIERYLARKYGFMGDNNITAAKIDSICECVRDIRDNYKRLTHYQEIRCAEELDNYFTVHLKKELEDLTKVLDSEGGYSVNNKLSLADISIYCLITSVFESPTHSHKELALKVAGRIPRIREIVVRVANEPKVREWTTKHPV